MFAAYESDTSNTYNGGDTWACLFEEKYWRRSGPHPQTSLGHFVARRFKCERMVRDGTSGKSARMRKCIENKSCKCTILRKKSVSIAMFFAEHIYGNCQSYFKSAVDHRKTIIWMRPWSSDRKESTKPIFVDSTAFSCLSKELLVWKE